MKVNWKDEEYISSIVAKSKSVSDGLIKLGIGVTGGNHLTLRKYIKIYELDISHFETLADRAKKLASWNTVELDDLLIEDGIRVTTSVKNRIIKNGLLKNECAICGNKGEWNNKTLVLQLDHKNGKNKDNRIENLRLLCPNCHTQTETFGSKQRKKKKEKIGRRSDIAIKAWESRRKCERPALETLLSEVNVIGFSATGRKYGVSDNAIRKWIIQYRKYMVD